MKPISILRGGVKFLLIQRTNNSLELAAIYTAADVFVNPTYEDTYPTVNLEAEACGTPIMTYRTGGAPETIKGMDSIAVPVGAIQDVAVHIRKMWTTRKEK